MHAFAPAAPLPVKYRKKPAPLPIKIMASLPRGCLQWLMVRAMAPTKPPLDGCDVLGEDACDPYEFDELIPGKLWQVRYKYMYDAKGMEAFNSMGPRELDELDAIVPEEMRSTIAADIERVKRLRQMVRSDKTTPRELYDSGLCFMKQSMIVSKLDSGELLLYNPCRMRPRVTQWLAELGQVGWIVSGSSSHTMQLPGAAKAFPYARIVATYPAERKALAAGMRPFDYDCLIATGPRSVTQANAALERAGGAKLYQITGDAFTNGTMLLTHGALLECDLLYGDATGRRWAFASPEQWRDDEALSGGRVFFHTFFINPEHSACPDSRFGCLPLYRYAGMDPTSSWAALFGCLNPPGHELQRDGSTAAVMANALRTVLALEFDMAVSAHTPYAGGMPADAFKRAMDASWRWLDGKSLLP